MILVEFSAPPGLPWALTNIFPARPVQGERVMTTSERYREIVLAVRDFVSQGRSPEGELGKETRHVEKASLTLGELAETVGEIPRIRLEAELTPVLLKAHGQLDRARMLFEEAGAEDQGATVWELEQKIYRLLNDL